MIQCVTINKNYNHLGLIKINMDYSKTEFLSFFELTGEDISHYYIFPIFNIETEDQTTMSLMNQLYEKISKQYRCSRLLVYEEYMSVMKEQNDMLGDMFVDTGYIDFLASLTRFFRSN